MAMKRTLKSIALTTGIVIALFSADARAATIEKVVVGAHENFTRVVFTLMAQLLSIKKAHQTANLF